MFKRTTMVLAATAMLGLAGCEADEETFEQGADFDEPAAVEQAPATPINPAPPPAPAIADTTMAPGTDTTVTP